MSLTATNTDELVSRHPRYLSGSDGHRLGEFDELSIVKPRMALRPVTWEIRGDRSVTDLSLLCGIDRVADQLEFYVRIKDMLFGPYGLICPCLNVMSWRGHVYYQARELETDRLFLFKDGETSTLGYDKLQTTGATPGMTVSDAGSRYGYFGRRDGNWWLVVDGEEVTSWLESSFAIDSQHQFIHFSPNERNYVASIPMKRNTDLVDATNPDVLIVNGSAIPVLGVLFDHYSASFSPDESQVVVPVWRKDQGQCLLVEMSSQPKILDYVREPPWKGSGAEKIRSLLTNRNRHLLR